MALVIPGFGKTFDRNAPTWPEGRSVIVSIRSGIALGVLLATLVNHAGAGGVGTLLAGWLRPEILNWAIVGSFVLMAGWILVPDKLAEGDIAAPKKAMGVFGATVFAFFLAEMGDKTQVATVALAAQYRDFLSVVSGTTL